MSLEGKTAVVTGASQGIGFAMAAALCGAGARVMLAARRPEPLDEALRELRSRGGQVEGFACDVREQAQAEELARRASGAYGRIDVLVNNVGASYGDDFKRGPLLEMAGSDLEGVMRQNVASLLNCCWAFVPAMLESSGSIVNTASVVVETPMKGFGLYAAAKSAVVSLTRTMALEWAPNVRANALLVGHVDTPRTSARRTPETRQWLEDHIALGRLGRPEDVAGAVVYLASDASAWVTGAALEITGGTKTI